MPVKIFNENNGKFNSSKSRGYVILNETIVSSGLLSLVCLIQTNGDGKYLSHIRPNVLT